MTNEQIKQGIMCCTSSNTIYSSPKWISCPYKEKVACRKDLREDLLKCLNAETTLKELLLSLYQRTEKPFTLERKDIAELAKEYGIREEKLR